jgi:hypothetical protein
MIAISGACLLLVCAFTLSLIAETRVWSARSGAQLSAELVELRQSKAVLRKDDGSLVEISILDLSASDQAYIKARAPATASGPTAGTAVFTVLTKPTGQQFTPRHVFAIWVSNDKNEFVKTLECDAKNYIRFLVDWTKASGGNKVDAITGASLTAHKEHSVTWDCRNAAGELVPDGLYRIRVEFSEKNGPGPSLPDKHVEFRKGPSPQSLKPKDLPYFTGMSVTYTPAARTGH